MFIYNLFTVLLKLYLLLWRIYTCFFANFSMEMQNSAQDHQISEGKNYFKKMMLDRIFSLKLC